MPSWLTSRSSRANARAKMVCAYLAAIVLPAVATGIGLHASKLHQTPFALSMVCIAVLASLAGPGPGVVAITTTALTFYTIIAGFPGEAFPEGTLGRIIVVCLLGLLVVALFSHQRAVADKLRSALDSLQEQRDALIQAQQANHSAAWAYNTVDNSMRWYEGGWDLFGRPFAELSALGSPMELVLAEDIPEVAKASELMRQTGHPLRVQFRVRWPNGEIHWLEARGIVVASNPSIWRGVTTDITERKQSELALIRSEKLAAVGRLASTIAHEINNPLEAVTNLLYIACNDTSISAEAQHYLRLADQELARLANITQRTLSFARLKHSSGPIDLAGVAEGVIAVFRAKCDARGAQVRFVPVHGLTIGVFGGDLRQILTNLLSNACDALPLNGGVIEVHTFEEAGAAVLLVEDNGSGIRPGDIDRIFDPFFTTKEDTGTGIGLWVTRELAQHNGGRIAVQTEGLAPGCNTCFRLEFPLAEMAGDGGGPGDSNGGVSLDTPLSLEASLPSKAP